MQLTQRFGPIPQQITLDGSGYGVIRFQPNGSNARITNLFCKVSTSVEQAIVNIYKGQIAESNIVFNSNSGSTGFNARGRIDVQDGEVLFVEWIGGDVGAIAYATFVGETIPFEEVISGSVIESEDPIAAGDGSLIFPALKSPNYVTGVAGWRIDRQGNVEFNNATIRGTLIAGNGNVILDNNGLTVVGDGPDANQTSRVTRSGGIYIESTQGGIVQLDTAGLSTGTPYLALTPVDQIGIVFGAAAIQADSILDGGSRRPYLVLAPASANGQSYPTVTMYGERADGTGETFIVNDVERFTVSGRVEVGPDDTDIGRGILVHTDSTSNSAAVGTTETVVLTSASATFRAGRAYKISSWARYGASSSVASQQSIDIRWRKTNLAGQNITISGVTGRIGLYPVSTTTAYGMYCETIFTVASGGSDVTAAIAMTMTAGGASPTMVQYAGRYFQIEDIGVSGMFPNVPVLV